mmetsp:Transcript_14485/g.39227  ORF Transcript_14485/g.39227 Transcript_14485/m.39227 type:complete len:224 (-) Transcript_14485:179-850(-)
MPRPPPPIPMPMPKPPRPPLRAGPPRPPISPSRGTARFTSTLWPLIMCFMPATCMAACSLEKVTNPKPREPPSGCDTTTASVISPYWEKYSRKSGSLKSPVPPTKIFPVTTAWLCAGWGACWLRGTAAFTSTRLPSMTCSLQARKVAAFRGSAKVAKPNPRPIMTTTSESSPHCVQYSASLSLSVDRSSPPRKHLPSTWLASCRNGLDAGAPIIGPEGARPGI